MKRIYIAIMFLFLASYAQGATIVGVCGLPSSGTVQVRVYDVTTSTETVAWTTTGVTERADGQGRSCYRYPATLTAGDEYQVDWKDNSSPIKTASEIISKMQTYADATTSSRSTYSGGAVASVTGDVGGSVASVTNPVTVTGDLSTTMKTSVTTAATASTPTVTLALSQPNYSPAKAGDAMTLTSVGIDGILDRAVEGSYTMRHLLRIMASALVGKVSGGGTTTITFRDLSDTKNRIVEVVDSNGNRSSITLNGN